MKKFIKLKLAYNLNFLVKFVNADKSRMIKSNKLNKKFS